MPGIWLALEILPGLTLLVPSAYVAYMIQIMAIYLMQVLFLLGLTDYWCVTLAIYLKKGLRCETCYFCFCWFESILCIANWGLTFLITDSNLLHQELQPSWCSTIRACTGSSHIHLCLGGGFWMPKPPAACFRNLCPVFYSCLYSRRLCMCVLSHSFPCTSPVHSHFYGRKLAGLLFG